MKEFRILICRSTVWICSPILSSDVNNKARGLKFDRCDGTLKLPLFTVNTINISQQAPTFLHLHTITYKLKQPIKMSTFRFSALSLELRLQIWEHALPGPRIVYIQRCLATITLSKTEPEDHFDIEQSYFPSEESSMFGFSSPSPSSSITSLLGTCAESRRVARMRYSTLYPYVNYEHGNRAACSDSFQVVDIRVKPTWFDFERDWLYLDWGHTNTNSPRLSQNYQPRDFLPKSRTHSPFQHSIPFADLRISEIRRLIVYNYGSTYYYLSNGNDLERRLRAVLDMFPGVTECVIADQMHGRDAHSQELEWLFGNLEDGLENKKSDDFEQAKYLLDEAERNWNIVNNSIIAPDVQWKNQEMYFNLRNVVKEWNSSITTKARRGPTIARKIITRSTTKNALLFIFGSEQNLRQQLGDYKWIRNVPNMPVPNIGLQQPGLLGLSKQIALMDLVLQGIQTEYEDELLRADFEYEALERIQYLLDKLDSLRFEMKLEPRSWEHLLIREAEEMGCIL